MMQKPERFGKKTITDMEVASRMVANAIFHIKNKEKVQEIVDVYCDKKISISTAKIKISHLWEKVGEMELVDIPKNHTRIGRAPPSGSSKDVFRAIDEYKGNR
jgi:hypothetical protein